MRSIVAILLLAATPALAENRFPQPVRAGSLVGQKLIAPIEAQPLLGRVEAVERATVTGLALRVRTGGRSVLVPLDQVALLGPEVALIDLSPMQLAALPEAPPGVAVPADETVRVGLTKPFH